MPSRCVGPEIDPGNGTNSAFRLRLKSTGELFGNGAGGGSENANQLSLVLSP